MAAPTTQSPADLLAELIRFDTTNPPGAEGPCLELIRGRFRERGIEGQLLAGDAARPNLVVRVPGRSQAPPLLLQGHVDVVTTVGQRWSRPPFAGEVADGEVWGRGALDMKGGVAMMVTALLRGLDEGHRPAGDVVLACVADEEAGGRHGAQYLAEQHPARFDGVRHGIGEGGGVRQNLAGRAFYPIMAAEKRACRLRMTFRGPGGHASRVHRGGTMAALGRALTALDEARLPVAVNPIVARLVETIAAHVAEPASSTFLALRDPARAEAALAALGEEGETLNPILHNTLNATVLRGGSKINVIPSEVRLELDGRVLPGVTADQFVAEVRAIVGPEPEIEVTNEGPFGPEPVLDGFFDLLGGIVEELEPGAIAAPTILSGATDARHFAPLGITGYGYLPLNLPDGYGRNTVHNADERVPAAALEFGTRAIAAVLDRYRG